MPAFLASRIPAFVPGAGDPASEDDRTFVGGMHSGSDGGGSSGESPAVEADVALADRAGGSAETPSVAPATSARFAAQPVGKNIRTQAAASGTPCREIISYTPRKQPGMSGRQY
jgi:hypothetical protein